MVDISDGLGVIPTYSMYQSGLVWSLRRAQKASCGCVLRTPGFPRPSSWTITMLRKEWVWFPFSSDTSPSASSFS